MKTFWNFVLYNCILIFDAEQICLKFQVTNVKNNTFKVAARKIRSIRGENLVSSTPSHTVYYIITQIELVYELFELVYELFKLVYLCVAWFHLISLVGFACLSLRHSRFVHPVAGPFVFSPALATPAHPCLSLCRVPRVLLTVLSFSFFLSLARR